MSESQIWSRTTKLQYSVVDEDHKALRSGILYARVVRLMFFSFEDIHLLLGCCLPSWRFCFSFLVCIVALWRFLRELLLLGLSPFPTILISKLCMLTFVKRTRYVLLTFVCPRRHNRSQAVYSIARLDLAFCLFFWNLLDLVSNDHVLGHRLD